MTAAIADQRPRFAELALTSIDPDPHNVRGDLGDLTELTASITANGVLQAVLVAEIPARGRRRPRWALIAGHRRYAAAKTAGLTTIPAQLRYDLDDAGRLTAQLTENLQRRDLTPIEEARGYQRLAELGLAQRAIATRVGCPQGQVSKRLALLRLPDSDQDDIATGRLGIAAGLELARLAAHPKAYKRARSAAADELIETAQLRRIINDELEELTWIEVRKQTRARLDSQRATVVAWPSSGSGWWSATYKPLADHRDLAGRRLGHGHFDRINAHQFATYQATDCGHVAWTIAPDGTPISVCTNPAAHEPKKPKKSRTNTTQDRRKAQLEAAAADRAAALDQLCDPDHGALQATITALVSQVWANDRALALVEVLAHATLRHGSPAVTCRRFGIEPDTTGPYKDWTAGIHTWIDQAAGPERVARLLTIAIGHATTVTNKTLRDGWSPDRHGARGLYQLLGAHGHQPSHAETSALAELDLTGVVR